MNIEKQTETPGHSSIYTFVAAGLISVLTALIAVSLSEAVRVPASPKTGSLLRTLSIWFVAVRESLFVLRLPAIVALFACALFGLKRTFPRQKRIFFPAEIVALSSVVLLCYIEITEYKKFIGYLPFIAVHILVFAGLVARLLLYPDRTSNLIPSRLKTLLGKSSFRPPRLCCSSLFAY